MKFETGDAENAVYEVLGKGLETLYLSEKYKYEVILSVWSSGKSRHVTVEGFCSIRDHLEIEMIFIHNFSHQFLIRSVNTVIVLYSVFVRFVIDLYNEPTESDSVLNK